MENIILTPKGKSYWNNEGTYEKEANELYDKLVPACGAAKTLNGELVRAANRLYHEYFNNGNENAAEVFYSNDMFDSEDEEEYCDEIESVDLSEYYSKFIQLIAYSVYDTFPQIADLLDDIIDIIKEAPYNSGNYFNDRYTQIYDHMFDYVIYFVMNNEKDSELPDWYKAE